MLGIEINPYAAELARLTVWITELQWQLRNGFGIKRSPILGTLDGIVCKDALVNRDGTEASWPEADVVVGNPPFLGGKLLALKAAAIAYVDRLFEIYAGPCPGRGRPCHVLVRAERGSASATAALARAGLVATNSIRGGANRRVLDAIVAQGKIFDAWSDENMGHRRRRRSRLARLFRRREPESLPVHLDGQAVATDQCRPHRERHRFHTAPRPLRENADVAFMGDTKGGAFDIPGALARDGSPAPLNPERTARTRTCCGPGSMAWMSRADPPINGSSISAGKCAKPRRLSMKSRSLIA